MVVSPTVANANYRPAGTQNQFQVLDLYVPPGTAPTNGWPVLWRVNCSSFINSTKDGALNGGLLQSFYDAGFAVVDQTVTVYPLTVAYSPIGGGMFWRPSDPDWDIDGAGHDIPHLDAVWARQWIGAQAATHDLDVSEVWACGSSAGSGMAAFVALQENLGDAGAAVAQSQQDTTCKGFIGEISQGWWNSFVQQAGPTSGTQPMASMYLMREDGATSNPCLSLEDAIATHVLSSSYNWTLVQAANLAANQSRPIYLRAGQNEPERFAIGPIDYTIDATTLLPNMAGTTTTGMVDIHDAAQMIITRNQLSAISPWHDTNSRLVSIFDWGTVGGVSPDAIVTSTSWWADAVAWVIGHLGSSTTDSTLNQRLDWSAGFITLCTAVQTGATQGMVQRRQTQTKVSRHTGRRAAQRWSVGCAAASSSEAALLVEAWKQARGAAGTVTFTPPQAGATRCRFIGDALRVVQTGPKSFRFQVELEEVL